MILCLQASEARGAFISEEAASHSLQQHVVVYQPAAIQAQHIVTGTASPCPIIHDATETPQLQNQQHPQNAESSTSGAAVSIAVATTSDLETDKQAPGSAESHLHQKTEKPFVLPTQVPLTVLPFSTTGTCTSPHALQTTVAARQDAVRHVEYDTHVEEESNSSLKPDQTQLQSLHTQEQEQDKEQGLPTDSCNASDSVHPALHSQSLNITSRSAPQSACHSTSGTIPGSIPVSQGAPHQPELELAAGGLMDVVLGSPRITSSLDVIHGRLLKNNEPCDAVHDVSEGSRGPSLAQHVSVAPIHFADDEDRTHERHASSFEAQRDVSARDKRLSSSIHDQDEGEQFPAVVEEDPEMPEVTTARHSKVNSENSTFAEFANACELDQPHVVVTPPKRVATGPAIEVEAAALSEQLADLDCALSQVMMQLRSSQQGALLASPGSLLASPAAAISVEVLNAVEGSGTEDSGCVVDIEAVGIQSSLPQLPHMHDETVTEHAWSRGDEVRHDEAPVQALLEMRRGGSSSHGVEEMGDRSSVETGVSESGLSFE